MSPHRTIRTTLRWLPFYIWQRAVRRVPKGRVHLIMALADHFEPAIMPGHGPARASRDEQERRLEHWCREYPRSVGDWRDVDGRPFRHTYFYPAEQYDQGQIERLADHCRQGWGEVEIHLHHGADGPDTAENTRQALAEFRDLLAGQGCLSRWDGVGSPRYAFVHGNFALANSAQGHNCGVDNEMQILSETGCYADLTLPSAPLISQTAKVNSLYECALPLDHRAPHRRGRDLECGRRPAVFPLIVQGPLMLGRRRTEGRRFIPGFDNAELSGGKPPTLNRLKLWEKAAVTVRGRPEWLFIKLHCHGMDPRDEAAVLGASLQRFLKDLTGNASEGRYAPHFVTAREMVNIALAACDGRNGSPGDYRDYRLRLIGKTSGA
jgi:hypothetical protein